MQPSKVTKVLAHKIHGGRKKDSKFWNHESALSNDGHVNINVDTNDYKRQKQQINPVWSVVWRFLLIMIVIDGSIYSYFHFVEKTTVVDGLKKIRSSIVSEKENTVQPVLPINQQHFEIKQDIKKEIKYEPKAEYQKHVMNTVSFNEFPVKRHTQEIHDSNKIYCWEDIDGKKNYSNIGYPSTGFFKVIPL